VAAGLTRQAHIWAVVGFSTEFWKQELWRALDFQTRDEFLTGFLEPYFTAGPGVSVRRGAAHVLSRPHPR
jgi:hypothetical protein